MEMKYCEFGTFGNLAYKACNETCGTTDYKNFLEHSFHLLFY